MTLNDGNEMRLRRLALGCVTLLGVVTAASAAGGAGAKKAAPKPVSTAIKAATTTTGGSIAIEKTAPTVPPPPAKITVPAKTDPLPAVELAVTPESTVNGGVALAVVKGLVEGDSVTGTFAGGAIPFTAHEGKATALVGIDINLTPGKKYAVNVKVVRGGKAIAKKALIAIADGKYPEETFEVPKEKDAGEDPKILARIKGDQRALAKFWPIWAKERHWAGNFIKPVPGDLSSRFGRRRIINGQPRLPHSGVDLRGTTGTPIVSPAAGRVVYVGDQFFSGNVTLVDHGQGVYSMFAHQSKVTVTEGQLVAAGEKIGEVGATGRVTGPHCHWGVRVNGARIDPEMLMALDLNETLPAGARVATTVQSSAGTAVVESMTTGTSGAAGALGAQ